MVASGTDMIVDMAKECPAATKNTGKRSLRAMSNETSKANVYCYGKDGTSWLYGNVTYPMKKRLDEKLNYLWRGTMRSAICEQLRVSVN